jgi:hypothetical protein
VDRTWRTTRLTRVDQAAVGLLLLQALYRGRAVFSGFFYEDDFRYVYDADTSSLGADYLLQDYNGHLMPGEFLLVWLLQRIAPMDFDAVAFVLLLLQVAASAMVWLLLRELVGPRPGALIGLAVYLFSPLTLGSFLWYAASLQAVPLQLVMAAALLGHVRHLRTDATRPALLALLAYTAGLVFWEKALLVVPVLVLVTLLWFGDGSVPARLRAGLVARWRLWSAYAAVSLGYLVLYVTAVRWQLGRRSSADSVVELAQEALLNGFVPALFGGPYAGFPTGLGLAPDPAPPVQALFLQALALLVVGTVLLNRGAWRAWFLLGCYLLLDVALLASGRIDVLGPIIGRDTRYLADASVVAAVAVTLAMLPLRGGEVARRRFDLGRTLDRPAVAGLLLLAYVNSCWITSQEMVRRWAETSAEPYVRNAQADLRRLGDVVVYDDAPPSTVLSPWFLEDHRVSRIIGPLPESPRFDEPSDDLRVVDEEGRLRQPELQVARRSPPGPDDQCGWAATGPAGVVVPVGDPLYPWVWTIRVGYFTGASTPGLVEVGGTSYRVRFQEGLHSLYLVHTGEVSDVTVTGIDRNVTVCIPGVDVGQL